MVAYAREIDRNGLAVQNQPALQRPFLLIMALAADLLKFAEILPAPPFVRDAGRHAHGGHVAREVDGGLRGDERRLKRELVPFVEDAAERDGPPVPVLADKQGRLSARERLLPQRVQLSVQEDGHPSFVFADSPAQAGEDGHLSVVGGEVIGIVQ